MAFYSATKLEPFCGACMFSLPFVSFLWELQVPPTSLYQPRDLPSVHGARTSHSITVRKGFSLDT